MERKTDEVNIKLSLKVTKLPLNDKNEIIKSKPALNKNLKHDSVGLLPPQMCFLQDHFDGISCKKEMCVLFVCLFYTQY